MSFHFHTKFTILYQYIYKRQNIYIVLSDEGLNDKKDQLLQRNEYTDVIFIAPVINLYFRMTKDSMLQGLGPHNFKDKILNDCPCTIATAVLSKSSSHTH